jgi:hypothetical protein
MILISLIVTLALIGFVLWLVVTYIPMPEPYKRALVVIVVLVIVLYLARGFFGGSFALAPLP